MNASVFAGSLLSGLVLTAPISAQQAGYSTYHRPPVLAYHRPQARRVIVVQPYAPRVLVVERIRAHRQAGYWARHGYRPVTLYYMNGRYYDRWVRGRGVREVVVYERNGRYYDAYEDHEYR